jgi:dethiobiotin synthetase
MKGVFITGTDTGVGKTVIGCALARALTRADVAVAARKPVESGCGAPHGEREPADGRALMQAAGAREPLDTVTPMRLATAVSPERAAHLEGVDLRLYDLLAAACTGAPDDFYLVEGAGGFYSPLATDAVNADLAVALALPVLVVAANRLGCVNHTLLTAEAIQHRGLRLAGVALNDCTPGDAAGPGNREDLEARLDQPIVGFEQASSGDGAVNRQAVERLAGLLMT